ncbi:MFS transporter [Brevibacillus sp. NRS-1366]|uniref:MFS transporter n=1 Tax=Brevibacillus sp. NRS-1366 TaxID=3233899 RepID=UPI003D21EAA3
MPRPYKNPIFFIALGLFGVYTIEFGVVGILPVIMERYEVTASLAGMLVGIFALVIALLGPFMVLLLSRYNRKKILMISLFIFTASSLLSAYAPNFYVLLALRIIPALFHPVYFSLAFVAARSLYPAEKMSFTEQLGILRKVPLWINIGAATFIFAAMFSVYSYSVEYLGQEMSLTGEVIGIMLVIFGIGGVAGNLFAGNLISRNKVKTTFFHPLALGLSYFLLIWGSSFSLPLVVIMIIWGAAHTSGLIVTQIWLTAEATEAPGFATALYISFINLGVTIGSATGGWFISQVGMQGTMWSGYSFILVALVCIGLRILLCRKERRTHAKMVVQSQGK